MTEINSSPSKPTKPGMPWLLILGLSSLALLWPLTDLIGIGEGAPRALVLIAVIAVTWIGVVGFGRVHNPVLTLTLTSIGYGIISLITAAILGDPSRPLWTYAAALVTEVFWGAIAGLLALAIQKAIGPKEAA